MSTDCLANTPLSPVQLHLAGNTARFLSDSYNSHPFFVLIHTVIDDLTALSDQHQ